MSKVSVVQAVAIPLVAHTSVLKHFFFMITDDTRETVSE